MSNLWYGTSGPKDAQIVILGEAWGSEEQAAQQPFVGSSGNELTRMLAEAGIQRNDVLCTNIVADRPRDNKMWRFFDSSMPVVKGLKPSQKVLDGLSQLKEQLASYPRQLIIGAGNYPLWALTEVSGSSPAPDKEARLLGIKVPTGISNWRGSMWFTGEGPNRTPYLPIIHPAAILRQWSLRSTTVHDLKARIPMALRGDWRPSNEPVFWAPPTFDQASSRLKLWISKANSGEKVRIASDIETIPSRKLLVCIGFADSRHFGMCIPFLDVKAGGSTTDYWTHQQEVELIQLIRRVLSHPNILLEGQNFNYDNQYIQKEWAITPLIDFDTMAAQHLLWPGTPKGLDHISSLYCQYHWYWKEDGKEWDVKGDLKRQLLYNCEDLVRTFEAAGTMRQVIKQLNLTRQWEETRERHLLALKLMNRGVLIDRKRRANQGILLQEHANRISGELEKIIPQWMLPERKKGAKPTKWYDSPKQQQYVFGELLGMRIPNNRKTGQPTLDKNALLDLGRKYPIWKGLFKRLGDLRSVEVFQSHFIGAALSSDNRMRCFFKVDGTETFRWSSSQNAFREGANLQTIPAGDEE